MSIIITGSPRSGTRMLRAAFAYTKLIQARHEMDGDDMTISSYLAVDTDRYPVAHEPYWNREVSEIWHVVRNPLYCIASLARHIPSRFWVWQYPHTGLHPRDFRSRREFAAHFWVRWNEETEKRCPVYRFRIEDLRDEWPEMWRRMGFTETPILDERSKSYRGIGRDNTRGKDEPLTWEELTSWSPSLCRAVQRKAEKYGYAD